MRAPTENAKKTKGFDGTRTIVSRKGLERKARHEVGLNIRSLVILFIQRAQPRGVAVLFV